MNQEAFILKFSQIPAAFLCNLEYLNTGEIIRTYNEGIKEKPNEFFSDLVFFYLYVCFFQKSANTINFNGDGKRNLETILASVLFDLKLSLQTFKRFFQSRFKRSSNFIQQAKLPYYNGTHLI